MTATLAPMNPASLMFSGGSVRGTREVTTEHRTWRIEARYGTADTDRWTVTATPFPGGDNPAASYEDGQYATLSQAREALATAIQVDNGESEEE